MAERVVKVTLRAQVAEYKKGMLEAAQHTRTVGTEAEKLAQKKQAFQQLGAASLAMGVTIGAGLTMAVAKFANFDQAMSNVAATGEDARNNIDALRDAAIDAGASTVFSAEESANAIEEMAKAGIDAADVLGGGLTGALDLAAAGGIGVADAAGIAATALKIFNLEGEDMSHVADLLAAGAGKAMGDVTDLSAALAQGGQVAAATGLSIEETTATLAAFASQGLLGSDAGTSFKTMLQRLTPQSAEAKKKMDELGISAYDAAGEFIGMEAFAGNLQTALKDLTPEQRNAALSIMFGSDAVRAANVLYKEGESGIRDWISAVDDQGYAAETAATRLDNLKGDWEALMGAADSALIGMGEAADGPLRGLVQAVTGLVDGFNSLPAGAQQAAFWVGTVGSVGATALGSYLLLVPKMAEFNNSLTSLSPSAANFAGKMASIAKYAGIAGGVAAGFTLAASAAVQWARDINEVDEGVRKATTTNLSFEDSMKGISVAADVTGDRVKTALSAIESGDVFGSVGTEILSVRDALTELDGGLQDIPIEDAAARFKRWGDELGLSRSQMKTMLNEMPQLRDAIASHLAATGKSADEQSVLNYALSAAKPAADDAAGATQGLADAAAEAETELSDMKAILDGIGGTAMDAGAAIDSAARSVNALAEAAKVEGVTIDGVNDSSIGFRDSIREVEQSHRDAAEAILANGGTMEEARAEWGKGRDAIIQQMESLGLSKDAATLWADTNIGAAGEVEQALADVKVAVDNIPPSATIDLSLTGAAGVYNSLMNIQAKLRQVTGDNTIRVATGGGGQGGQVAGNHRGGFYSRGVKQFYQGGFESGIYAGVQGGIHKFAESEMGVPWETYISGRSADRERNIGIWQRTGEMLGMGSGGGAETVVSIEGGVITGRLEIGGDGLARIVDGRISLYDKEQSRAAAAGYAGGI